MKRVLYFIGLKVVEIGGIAVGLFVLHWVGYLVFWLTGQKEPVGMCILIGVLVSFVMVFVVGVLCEVVRANWNKAGELANKREDNTCDVKNA